MDRAAPGLAPDAAWWSHDEAALAAALASSTQGLSSAEAARRLALQGPNSVAVASEAGAWRLLARQFASPLVLILVVAALLSLLLRDWTDALAILVILAGSALLGFAQELRAGQALAKLRARLALTARVWRDGALVERPVAELVSGDVIELDAGSLVPADGRVLAAHSALADQASLTGEALPIDKLPGTLAADTPLAARSNCVHLGTSLRSGTATVMVVHTGRHTVLAELAERLHRPEPETGFERGVRRFGELLLRVMFGVVVAVLVANQWLGRPLVESLLFAAALAVGLSPELLPAIVSVSLSRGATALAAAGVLVRRLGAIEDLGGIDVLCTDKTGTLTVGVLALAGAVDAHGEPSDEVLRLAYLNAAFETGIRNPIDAALVEAGQRAGLASSGWSKVDEIPYDFERRRLTVVLQSEAAPAQHLLITKGAAEPLLALCELDDATRAALVEQARQRGELGQRVLAVATRALPARAAPAAYTRDDETALAFAGFVCFADRPKPDAAHTLHALHARGVRVKLVTGDNRHVAAHLAVQVGLDGTRLLTGAAVASLHDTALAQQARRAEVFAEVDPVQKERIVRALQRSGHAVGFLGDGINDAPALHAADVGISVDSAVDVARESADVVLLRSDLGLLERGIAEGRRCFANTLKYIQITTSANFGNMVSMALATPLLPFLPLTATQILLNNLLSDLPAIGIGADHVDAAALRHAQRWDLAEVRRFMLVFGLLSSLFDGLAFALLLAVFAAGPALFHSGWFVISLLTELAVVLVLRTHGPAWRSRPGRWLVASTALVAALALLLPFSGPLARMLGFVPLPLPLALALVALLLAYAAATEAAKRWFFAPHRQPAGRT